MVSGTASIAFAGLSYAGNPACPKGSCSQDGTRRHPDIILIMTDQQRADALGCVTDGVVITPNLDSLASEGYLFTSAYSSTPSSTPARAGLLTGCSPWAHGMLGYGNQAEVYPNEMPGMLKQNGYAALAVGKMHYYPQNNRRGFDVVLFDESGRHTTPHFESDYRQWFHSTRFGDNPDATGITWNEHRASAYALPEEVHPTRWTADRAVEMIEGYRSDKPMFLKVSFARPHSPYDPPQRILDRYEGRKALPASCGDWEPEQWRMEKEPSSDKNAFIGHFPDSYVENSRLHYYASVTFVDEQIGRVLDALKENGRYDNALIVFISDHGDMLGDHYLWRKTYPYEGSAAVPFIVKLPEWMETCLPAGSRVDAPVELRDVLPTFLDIAGARQPETMDGMSVLPLLTEKSIPWRKYIDLEHARIYWDGNSWTALTDGHFKYVWLRALGKEQLFFLDADPGETRDLSGVRKYSSVLKEMRSAMKEHLKVRGPQWVSGDTLVVSGAKQIYGPNFPDADGRK
ncbi:MAG: arylsulfatase [Candidatus Cryptobacteroides sp.]